MHRSEIGGATLCFQHVTDSLFDSMIRSTIRALAATRQPAFAAPSDSWRAPVGVAPSILDSQRITTDAGGRAGVIAR